MKFLTTEKRGKTNEFFDLEKFVSLLCLYIVNGATLTKVSKARPRSRREKSRPIPTSGAVLPRAKTILPM